jgi:hypothetical protein
MHTMHGFIKIYCAFDIWSFSVNNNNRNFLKILFEEEKGKAKIGHAAIKTKYLVYVSSGDDNKNSK